MAKRGCAPGEAIHNDQPLDADIAFRLTYEYEGLALLEDVGKFIEQSWLILPLGAILFLPGWLLLDLSGIKRRFDSGEAAAISVGISLALIPLVMLWTSILQIEWTRNKLLFVTGFLVALMIIRIAYKYFSARSNIHKNIDHPEGVPEQSDRNRSKIWLGYWLALILVFLSPWQSADHGTRFGNPSLGGQSITLIATHHVHRDVPNQLPALPGY
jgi:hypothetical protein